MELTLLTPVIEGRGAKTATRGMAAESGAFARDLAQASGATARPAPAEAAAMTTASETTPPLKGRDSLMTMPQAPVGERGQEAMKARLSEIAERLVLIETAGREADPSVDTTLAAREAEAASTAWPPLDGEGAVAEIRLDAQGALPEISAEAMRQTEGEVAMEIRDQLVPRDDLAVHVPAQPGVTGQMARDAMPDGSREGRPTRGEALSANGLIQAARMQPAEPPGALPEPSLARTQMAEPPATSFALPAREGDRLLDPRGETLLAGTSAAGGNGQALGTQANGLTGNTPTPAAMTAALNSPAWPQQLGQQLMMLSQRGGEQRVELHLNPAELGPLSISLKMNEQTAQIQFLAAHAQVRGAVEQAIPQLREALAEQGIQLGETSVGEQRQQSGREFASASGPGTLQGEGSDETGDDALASGMSRTADSLVDGRVDLYA